MVGKDTLYNSDSVTGAIFLVINYLLLCSNFIHIVYSMHVLNSRLLYDRYQKMHLLYFTLEREQKPKF
jgi:hypothetical protein